MKTMGQTHPPEAGELSAVVPAALVVASGLFATIASVDMWITLVVEAGAGIAAALVQRVILDWRRTRWYMRHPEAWHQPNGPQPSTEGP
ncbi:hypothetical protein [Streptomyces sp. NRRL F-4489]|uniref:hypothetical protein n=1 Tax=Streptomyces sp. NRRL F-4489 TaxID=1609095 RepID=UPI00131E7F0E|nr:hypothetical protein [Streptomyces sp. NRRL F-4489]